MKLTYNDFEKTALELLSTRSEMKGDELLASVIERRRLATVGPATPDAPILVKILYAPLMLWSRLEAKMEITNAIFKDPDDITLLQLRGYILRTTKFDPETETYVSSAFYSITDSGKKRLADLNR